MARLTKEQRAQREAAQKNVAVEQNVEQVQDSQEPPVELAVMVTDYQMFPGAPTTANVHPDEVENWKTLGWKTQE